MLASKAASNNWWPHNFLIAYESLSSFFSCLFYVFLSCLFLHHFFTSFLCLFSTSFFSRPFFRLFFSNLQYFLVTSGLFLVLPWYLYSTFDTLVVLWELLQYFRNPSDTSTVDLVFSQWTQLLCFFSNSLVSLSYSMAAFSTNSFGLFYINFWALCFLSIGWLWSK